MEGETLPLTKILGEEGKLHGTEEVQQNDALRRTEEAETESEGIVAHFNWFKIPIRRRDTY